MDYHISYRNTVTTNIILAWNSIKKVKEYKSDLSKDLNILPEYIYLKFENVILEDDAFMSQYGISNNNKIMMTIAVLVKEVKPTKDHHYKHRLFFLEYDESVHDLRTKYCNTVKTENVKITCRGECNEDKLVRHYLDKANCIFSAFEQVQVHVINEYNEKHTSTFYWNDTFQSIKTKLVKDHFFSNETCLMVGKKYVLEKEELNEYIDIDPLEIFACFHISVKNGDQLLLDGHVNVNTLISQVKSLLAAKFGLELNMISLMKESKYLIDEKTVGFYQLKIGEQLEFVLNQQILISRLDNDDIIEYIVKKYQTVVDIKKELAETFEIGTEKIVLSLDGEELSNELILNDLKFNDATILLMTVNNGSDLQVSKYQLDVEKDSINFSEDKIERGSFAEEISNLKSSINDEINILTKEILEINDLNVGDQTKEATEKSELYDQKISIVQDEELPEKSTAHDAAILTERANSNFDEEEDSIIIERNSDAQHLSLDTKEIEDAVLVNIIDSTIELSVDCYVGTENTTTLISEDLLGTQIKLYVRNRLSSDNNHNTKEVSVCVEDTIEFLRHKLEGLFSVTLSDCVLCIHGRILSNDAKIGSCQIKEGDQIDMSHSLLVKCIVSDDDSRSRIHRFAFHPEDKVSDLKRQITDRISVESRMINLSFDGSSLEENSNLGECGVENDSYLMMALTPADN